MDGLSYSDILKIATEIAVQNKLNSDNINIQQNSNGRYCVEIEPFNEYSAGITMYIPENVSGTTTISTYVHGSGGSSVGPVSLNYESSNVSNVITVYPRGKTSYDSTAELVVNSIGTIEENLNINTVEYATSGFSAGDTGCMNIATALIKERPSAYHNVTFVDPKMDHIDFSGKGSNISKMSDSDAMLFKNDNVHITAYMTENNYGHNAENNDSWLRNFYKPFADNENFLLVADGTVGEHGNYRNRIIEAGVMNGGFDWINNIGLNNPNLSVKTRYLNEKNSSLYIDFSNKILTAATMASKSANLFGNEMKNVTSDALLGSDMASESFVNQKSLYSNGSSMVVSDFEFVDNSINNFSEILDKSVVLTKNVDNLEDVTGMQTVINVKNVYNNFITSSKKLLSDLFMTNFNILKIASSIDKVDKDLSAIIDGGNSSVYENVNSNMQPVLSERILFNNASDLSENIIKVKLEDLQDACSDKNPILSFFSQDLADTKNIRVGIRTIINDFKNNLKGGAWDTVIDRLNSFDDLLGKKSKYAEKISINIKNSYNSLINYFQKYDLAEVDTSKTAQFEEKLEKLKSDRIALAIRLNQLQATHGDAIFGYDENGNSVIYGYIDNSAEIELYKSQITNIDNLVDLVQKLLEGYYGLPGADKIAASIINSSFDNLVFDDPSLNKISNSVDEPF